MSENEIQSRVYQKDGKWLAMYDGYTLPRTFESRDAAFLFLRSQPDRLRDFLGRVAAGQSPIDAFLS